MLRFALVAALAAALPSGAARADRKELYAVLGYSGGLSNYRMPAPGSATVSSYAGALDLSVYYGLTNKLHVGARLRGSSSTDVRFAGVRLAMPDGTESTGDVYDDHRSLGIGALLVYRFNTGYTLAPVLELEGGATAHQYRSIIHVPVGQGYSIPLDDVSETHLHAGAGLLLEYRFADRWVASTGLAVHVEDGGLAPWSVSVPLRLGYVW